MIPTTQMKKGMIIKFNGELYQVMLTNHVAPGNWRAMVQTKLRNLKTGNQIENRFSADDKVEKVSLDEKEMEYLYADANGYHFMDTETYDQVHLPEELIGDDKYFLLENQPVKVVFYEHNAIALEVPITVTLEVIETEPELKGATASNSNKPAKLQTGVSVQVPPFVKVGDKIKVDTRDKKYISRA